MTIFVRDYTPNCLLESDGERLGARKSEEIGCGGAVRIDYLENACKYCRSRGNETAESLKSRSLMDPSREQ